MPSSTWIEAYIGQPCPEASATVPLTVTSGSLVSATVSVLVVFAVTTTPSFVVA